MKKAQKSDIDDDSDEDAVDQDIEDDPSQLDPGFIKFYGIFWSKDKVDWSIKRLLGRPEKWMGQGNIAENFDWETVQMNFWSQKGIYILYNNDLMPVYAGQAGAKKGKKGENMRGCIGDRLNLHRGGIYQNGWRYFSWFGFLDHRRINLREAKENDRMNPKWKNDISKQNNTFERVLSSFEAILIEGFAPRFNARGGDLKEAILVKQYTY